MRANEAIKLIWVHIWGSKTYSISKDILEGLVTTQGRLEDLGNADEFDDLHTYEEKRYELAATPLNSS